MRVDLVDLEKTRSEFCCLFERYGSKNGNKTTVLFKTVLLIDSNDRSTMVCDHVWCNDTLGLQELDVKQGTAVSFRATVKRYRKGSVARGIPVSFDFRLERPSNFQVVDSVDHIAYLTCAIKNVANQTR